jgi:menaquinone-dependent protoporphyrinogen oxidase
MAERRLLIVYATSEGHTARVADRVAEVVRRTPVTVEVHPVEEAPDPTGFDAVVVGGSIHQGHHSRHLVSYLTAHKTTLSQVPTALFQVSLTSASPDDTHTAKARSLVDELDAASGFDPDVVGMFAGALLYTRYGWFKRHLMRTIVRREGGDTDTSRDYEYTDWDAVEHFARDVAELAAASSPD